MIRFRREIQPMKKFDIETRLGGIDERNIWCYQTFHYSNNKASEDESGSSPRGKILAQVLTQGVITNKGKVVNPREWLSTHFPTSKESIDELSVLPSEDGSSVFDTKAARFKHLEEALKHSAALYDEETV